MNESKYKAEKKEVNEFFYSKKRNNTKIVIYIYLKNIYTIELEAHNFIFRFNSVSLRVKWFVFYARRAYGSVNDSDPYGVDVKSFSICSYKYRVLMSICGFKKNFHIEIKKKIKNSFKSIPH